MYDETERDRAYALFGLLDCTAFNDQAYERRLFEKYGPNWQKIIEDVRAKEKAEEALATWGDKDPLNPVTKFSQFKYYLEEGMAQYLRYTNAAGDRVHWTYGRNRYFCEGLFKRGLELAQKEQEEDQAACYHYLYMVSRNSRYEKGPEEALIAFCSTPAKIKQMFIVFIENDEKEALRKCHIYCQLRRQLLKLPLTLDEFCESLSLIENDNDDDDFVREKMKGFLKTRKIAEDAAKKFAHIPKAIKHITFLWEMFILLRCGVYNDYQTHVRLTTLSTENLLREYSRTDLSTKEILEDYGTLLTPRMKSIYKAEFIRLCCKNIAELVQFLSSTEEDHARYAFFRKIARAEFLTVTGGSGKIYEQGFYRPEIEKFTDGSKVHEQLMAYASRLDGIEKFFNQWSKVSTTEEERAEVLRAKKHYYETHLYPPVDV